MKNSNFLLLLFMLVNLFSWSARGQEFAGGEGTQENPYLISNAQHLESIRQFAHTAPAKYYKLVADVDLISIANWVQLSSDADGIESSGFAYMHLDGNGHIIKNLTSKYPGEGYYTNYWGFAGILCGSIKNLGFIDVDVQSVDVGPIAGAVGRGTPAVGDEEAQRGYIENCFVTGTVTGTGRIGGVAGQIGQKGSYVKNCYSTCDVINTATSGTTNFTGGVVGVVAGSAANNSIAISYVENCYATGSVICEMGRAGGVLGLANGGAILNGVALNKSLTMTAPSDPFGTIVGFIHSVSAPYCTGEYIAADGIPVMRGGLLHTPENFAVIPGDPIDGVMKDSVYLSDPSNYSSIGFSIGSVWANDLANKIYPQLLWVSQRLDAGFIDGLQLADDFSSVIATTNKNNKIISSMSISGYLNIQSEDIIRKIEVFTLNGQSVFESEYQSHEVNIDMSSKLPALYIVKINTEEKSYTIKILKK